MNQVLFISGLKFTTVAHSALVVTFGPLFTLLFAWQRARKNSRAQVSSAWRSRFAVFSS